MFSYKHIVIYYRYACKFRSVGWEWYWLASSLLVYSTLGRFDAF